MIRSRPFPVRMWASVVGAAALALSVLSASALADWEDDPAAQLRWDYECLVQYYSGVIERMIEGQLVVIPKTHSEAGRSLEAGPAQQAKGIRDHRMHAD